MSGKKIFLKNINQFNDYYEYHEKIKKVVKRSLIIEFYKILIFLDLYFQILIRIKIPLLFRRGIITDRYLYGTLIDMAANFGFNKHDLEILIKDWQIFFPKPGKIFLIDLPEEIAFKRKNDIPSIDYLKFRRKQYLDLPRFLNIIRLDGLCPPEELKEIAMNSISTEEFDE